MTTDNKKMSLTTKVLLGMGLGVVAGFIFRTLLADVPLVQEYIVGECCKWAAKSLSPV